MHQQPSPERAPGDAAVVRLHRDAHQRRQQRRDVQHQPADERVRREQRPAPDRKRVQQPHGARARQIAHERHRQHAAEHEQRPDKRGIAADDDLCRAQGGRHLLGRPHARRPEVHRQAHEPHAGIDKRNRPVPPQVAAGDGFVKERCRGPHSRHLPSHR